MAKRKKQGAYMISAVAEMYGIHPQTLRDLGVNISGIAIILQMRERMEEMQRQMADFVTYVRNEVMARAQHAADPSRGAIIPLRRSVVLKAEKKK